MLLSTCKVCSRLPSTVWINRQSEEDLPGPAYRLEGIPAEPPDDAIALHLRCPECGIYYRYEVSPGCLSHDVGLIRLLPGEMRAEGLIWKWRYNRLIRDLPPLLDGESTDLSLYAARALARHYLDNDLREGLEQLCRHPNWAIRRQAVLEVGEDEMTPHIALVIELLFDHAQVADAAKVNFRVFQEKSPLILKYGERLVGAFADRQMSYYPVIFLKHITQFFIELVDITPCVSPLMRFLMEAVGEESLCEEARHSLIRYVRASPANAQFFLKTFEEIVPPDVAATLADVRAAAQISLGR